MADIKFVVEEVKDDCFTETKQESKPPVDDPQTKAEETEECFSRLNINQEPTEEEVVKSRNFITNFLEFIQSNSFFNTCDEIAKRKNVTQKQVAKNFFEHVLGTVSDVAHIVIDTVQDVAVTLLDVLSKVLSAGASVICNVARKIVRVVTLNKTCVA